MGNILKPKVILPIIAGLLIGAAFFAVGYSEDAPGMCVLGISAAFLLILVGIHGTGKVKAKILASIAFLCFGAGSVFLSVVLLQGGEFEDKPWIAAIGAAIGIALLTAGVRKFRKTKEQSYA